MNLRFSSASRTRIPGHQADTPQSPGRKAGKCDRAAQPRCRAWIVLASGGSEHDDPVRRPRGPLVGPPEFPCGGSGKPV